MSNENEKTDDELFDEWFETFSDVFEEEGVGMMVDRADARRLWRKGYTPERAAQSEIHFMMTGGQ